jgi:ribosomal protein S18 acetylase RimI-like enzyme
MILRQALPEDAEKITELLLMAMVDIIFVFIGQKDETEAKNFLLPLVAQTNTQYSYENCLVAEENGKIIAAANVYDGAQLVVLREPVLQQIRKIHGADFYVEDETGPGEIYLDCLAVDPEYRGRGLGSEMLTHLIRYHVGDRRQKLGLLVDEDNPDAKRLYLRSGFHSVGRKTLAGKNMEHLQVKPEEY